MNNISITKFRWSQKIDSILNRLGIFTIADFEGVSLKALKEMGIPEKTIKQIEDICKVHNIMTKESNGLKGYWFEYYFRHIHDENNSTGFPRMSLYVAYNEEHAKELFLRDYNGETYELIGDYSIEEIQINIGDRLI
jgi:hypothetical protein